MKREAIFTNEAPEAIGTYSQAVRVENTVYLSGQIGLNPSSMLLESDVEGQLRQIFRNLQAVSKASGGGLENILKLNIYLTDLSNFPMVNKVMAEYFNEPYPARAAVGVLQLPRGAQIEVDGIMYIEN